MTQLLNPIDLPEAKYLEVDVRYLNDDERGSGRLDAYAWLYGDSQLTEEDRNILYSRVDRTDPANLAPDEIFSQGYRDGLNGESTLSLINNSQYSAGWAIGNAERPPTFITAWTKPTLDQILSDWCWWAERADDFRQVRIDFDPDTDGYAIAVESSLLDRVLPF